jgi:glycosyltransferase involved in cell wall biosynthesis
VGGVAATVRSGENGVVLPNATSSDSFARELIALAANPDTRQAFSQEALKLSSSMTAEVMTHQTQRVYELAVDRRRN